MTDSRWNLKLEDQYQKRLKIVRNHLAVRDNTESLSLARTAEMCIEHMEKELGITPPDKENK